MRGKLGLRCLASFRLCELGRVRIEPKQRGRGRLGAPICFAFARPRRNAKQQRHHLVAPQQAEKLIGYLGRLSDQERLVNFETKRCWRNLRNRTEARNKPDCAIRDTVKGKQSK
jgi:hypothetical protein